MTPANRFRRQVGRVLMMVVIGLVSACRDDGSTGPDLTASVILTAPEPLNFIGDQDLIEVNARSSAGEVVSAPGLMWTSLDPGIATVDQAGMVTSVTRGEVRVVAALEGLADTVTVVSRQVPATVVTPLDSVGLLVGDTHQTMVTFSDSGGTAVPEAVASFSSADPGIASVGAEGLITGEVPGLTTVTVVETGFGVATLDITVGVFGSPETLVGSVTVPNRPFGIAVGPQSMAYVARVGIPEVSRLDLSEMAITNSFRVGVSPTDVAISLDGSLAWVTNQVSESVGLVEVGLDRQFLETQVPGRPFRVRVMPDGSSIYVTLNNGIVARITPGGELKESVEFPAAVNGVAYSGEFVYVSLPSGMVGRFVAGSTTVDRTYSVPGKPQEIVVSPDGNTAYIANESLGLSVLDVATGNVTIVNLSGGGFGMAVSPGWDRLYVTVPARGNVEIVDLGTLEVVSTLSVGGAPRRIAFDRFGTVAVVANEEGWVDVLR